MGQRCQLSSLPRRNNYHEEIQRRYKNITATRIGFKGSRTRNSVSCLHAEHIIFQTVDDHHKVYERQHYCRLTSVRQRISCCPYVYVIQGKKEWNYRRTTSITVTWNFFLTASSVCLAAAGRDLSVSALPFGPVSVNVTLKMRVSRLASTTADAALCKPASRNISSC